VTPNVRACFFPPTILETQFFPTVLNVFFSRALNERIASGPHSVIANSVNPGLCYSELRRELTGFEAIASYIMEKIMARTAEVGSRTLVHAAVGQPDREDELRGAYLNCCQVGEVGDYVVSPQGRVAQNKIWVSALFFSNLIGKTDVKVACIE
jgi:retinol dehydrogenase-12